MFGFLAQEWVLNALGVPLNYTDIMDSVNAAFQTVGDYSRSGYTEALERVLDAGGKVSLMFGDRDVVSAKGCLILWRLTAMTRLVPGPVPMPLRSI
jgi:hypothetical protein